MKTIKINKSIHLKIKIEAAKREVNVQDLIEILLEFGLDIFETEINIENYKDKIAWIKQLVHLEESTNKLKGLKL